MKKNFKYFAMAAMAILSMSACNKEIDEQVLPDTGKGKQPVEFKMTLAGTNTRTTTGTDAARTTTWNEGDAVGIFVYEAGQTTHPVIANAKYVLTGDTWAAEAGSEIYPEATYDYYAYYPYQEGATNPAQISISAKADQSAASGADYGASDVLASQNKNVAANVSTVPLTFKHMFAMIEVKIDGDKVTQQPAKVELKGVKLDATLDIITSTPTAALANNAVATDITMYYLTKTENATTAPFSFRAVVPAQEIAAATPLVAIYDVDGNGKTYTMQHTAAVPYEPGNFRLLNVTIGTAKVSLEIPKADLTIDPWGASEPIDGEGSEVIIPLITPFGETLTPIAENKPATPTFTSDTWFALKKADYQGACTFSIEADDNTTWKKAAKLEFTSLTAQGGSWFIAAIGYFHSTPLDITKTSIYKLTFKVKASQNTGTADTEKVVIACRNATENGTFQVSAATTPSFSETTATSTTKTLKAADTWETVTIYINFKGKGTGVGSISYNNTYSTTTAEDYAQCNIRFYPAAPKTSPGTSSIYISDVELEPYIK